MKTCCQRNPTTKLLERPFANCARDVRGSVSIMTIAQEGNVPAKVLKKRRGKDARKITSYLKQGFGRVSLNPFLLPSETEELTIIDLMCRIQINVKPFICRSWWANIPPCRVWYQLREEISSNIVIPNDSFTGSSSSSMSTNRSVEHS